MTTIYYPAVFHHENNSYWIDFPDLDGCFSDGKTIEEAYNHAKEALGFYLDQDNDLYQRSFKSPSSVNEIVKKYPNEIVMLIEFNSLEYFRLYKNKAIKKTLTIPEWLNDIAIQENINFSNVLQEALIQKLNLK